MRTKLRLFTGDDAPSLAVAEPDVPIQLGELTRILSDAITWDRTWLKDLSDDEIMISPDLYEILLAYSDMRPSA